MASYIPLNQRPTFLPSPVETPAHGSGGVFTLSCSATIAAPLRTILETLLDTRSYPAWNAFVPSISISKQPDSPPPFPECLSGSEIVGLDTTLQKGTEFVLDVHLDPNNARKRSPTALVLSILEDFESEGRHGVRVAWKTGGWTPGFLLRTERIQEFLETGDGIVEYRCWETMYGLLASTVRYVVGNNLIWGFGAWMDGLKEYSEKQSRPEGEAPGQLAGTT